MPAIRCPMMKLFRHFHHPALLNKSQHHRASQKVIMIADGQSNAGSAPGQIHQASDNQIAFSLPVPATLQTPSVDKVTNKIKILRLMSIEKFQERLNP